MKIYIIVFKQLLLCHIVPFLFVHLLVIKCYYYCDYKFSFNDFHVNYLDKNLIYAFTIQIKYNDIFFKFSYFHACTG